MRFRGLIPGALGTLALLLLALPADAARLQFWRFNADENRLIFTTDTGVRPRAQLIQNPTRIVIDLPGVTLDRVTPSQMVGGAIREVRVGQFDSQTARLVIELSPGYTVDPQQVVVQGSTMSQWVVQLPQPQRVEGSASADPGTVSVVPERPHTPVVPGASTRLDGVRVTQDGLFLQTEGAVPNVELDRRRRGRLVLVVENTALSDQVPDVIPINQFGLEELRFVQEDDDPPTVEVELERTNQDARWQASATRLGGIALVPASSGGVIADRGDRPTQPPAPSSPPPAAAPAITTIQSVELANNGTQLVIRADQPIQTYQSGWDRATTDYQVVIPNARLAEAIANPQIPENGPLLRIRLREENNSVIVSLLPASGIQLGQVNQPSQQMLALAMQSNRIAVPGFTPGTPAALPNVDGRVVVVIDPGHGGRDPGAIGIGGLQERNVVLPMSLRVASLLQQQGVTVVMTRTNDQSVELEGRVQIAERANANLFVSIHANAISMSRPEVNGIETYYYSNEGLRLARVIHNSMMQAVGGPDRGVRQARFYVIRRTSMPAVLLETGFVTGARDAPLLRDPAYQEQLAQAIARGILQYIQQTY